MRSATTHSYNCKFSCSKCSTREMRARPSCATCAAVFSSLKVLSLLRLLLQSSLQMCELTNQVSFKASMMATPLENLCAQWIVSLPLRASPILPGKHILLRPDFQITRPYGWKTSRSNLVWAVILGPSLNPPSPTSLRHKIMSGMRVPPLSPLLCVTMCVAT